MVKHFILNLNPHAQFEWERCALHNPITAEQPDFAQILATNLSEQAAGIPKSGSYLIAVKIEVTVLETNAIEPIASPISPRLTRTLDHRTPLLAEVA